MSGHADREQARTVAQLISEGFTVRVTTNKHAFVRNPVTGVTGMIASSRSDWRAAKNNEATLRRLRRPAQEQESRTEHVSNHVPRGRRVCAQRPESAKR